MNAAVVQRLVLCLSLVAALAATAAAQSSSQANFWTRDTLNNLAIRNSAQNYSVERYQRRLINSSVPQYNFSSNNFRGLFNPLWGTGPRSKPFSGMAGPGAVTPYLSLSEPFSSSAHNYYTQVRPQLDQQRFNQQAALRARQMQQQLNSLTAQPPYSPVGDANRAPTGHAAVFMNLGGYYPQPAPPRR